MYYAYNNIKINIPTNNIEANQEKQDEIKQSLVYNLNFEDATHIILVGSAGNENVVKGIVNTMNVGMIEVDKDVKITLTPLSLKKTKIVTSWKLVTEIALSLEI